MRKGSFLLGIIAGALAGVVAGVLYAPRSGKETRKIIGKKTKDVVKNGERIIETNLQNLEGKVKETAETISSKIKS